MQKEVHSDRGYQQEIQEIVPNMDPTTRKSAREYDICGLQCCGCILTVPMRYLKGRICSGHALEWRRC
jgi:hypothetical protein